MLFNSLTFVLFFAAILAAYWSMRSWSGRKNVLLAGSYLFYGAWNPPFVLLLIVSTIVDWIAGARLAAEQHPFRRRVWLVISLVSNLGMLGFFKYGNFLLENTKLLLGRIGIDYQPPHLDVLLPVGISFYTFQTLSYTLDIYRREIKPAASLRDFALYVAFFPQLVAGPIVRAVDFLPQCVTEPKPRANRTLWGLFLMTLGLFQKVVLADTLVASSSDTVFGHGGPVATLDAWTGVLAFSAQIFFDFAGYSTCAIGAALCLGFSLPDNFRFPYAAVGVSDFWRRWHISLSTWLRDYLYIPLGGNRSGAARTAVNLMIVMFLGGLWHGAAWTFVAWGLIHGAYLVIEHVLRSKFGSSAAFRGAVWTAVFGLVTYLAICFAWVFFRAGDFGTASRIVQSLFGGGGDALLSTRELIQVGAVTVLLLAAHWTLRNTTIETAVNRLPSWCLTGTWAAMALAIIITQDSGNAFIYFQF